MRLSLYSPSSVLFLLLLNTFFSFSFFFGTVQVCPLWIMRSVKWALSCSRILHALFLSFFLSLFLPSRFFLWFDALCIHKIWISMSPTTFSQLPYFLYGAMKVNNGFSLSLSAGPRGREKEWEEGMTISQPERHAKYLGVFSFTSCSTINNKATA